VKQEAGLIRIVIAFTIFNFVQGAINAFDCIRGTEPVYFKGVCVPVNDISGRVPTSTERHDMLVPHTKTQFGQLSFHIAAPTIWNLLPTSLCSGTISRRQFRFG